MEMPGSLGVAKISKIVDYIEVKAKDLVRKLTALGAAFEWGKGSHLNVTLNGKKSVVPVHAGKDLGIGLIKSIERHLNVRLR